MRTKITSFTLACGLCATLIVPGCNKEKGAEMTAAEAKSIASEAWVFGMPLIYIDKQIDLQTHVPKPEGTVAPINQLASHNGVSAA